DSPTVIACPSGRKGEAAADLATSDAGRATIGGNSGRRNANKGLAQVYAGGTATASVLKQVRSLCPLPDTAYELNVVRNQFSCTALVDGAEATEENLRKLSAEGQLERYRIVHFATHGLVADDMPEGGKQKAEPALVLTPPDVAASDADDGLLTASEVAQLRLNADWVVLSACSTAAGDQTGGEALSGLARAFFYAGTRALLASHWPVYSDAAVRLT